MPSPAARSTIRLPDSNSDADARALVFARRLALNSLNRDTSWFPGKEAAFSMDFTHPPRMFVFVDGVLAPRIFPFFYRGFASSIGLNGDENVLEFGGGSGGISERLAGRLKHGSLTCMDICPPMLEIAKRRLRKFPQARCLQGRIEDLDLRTGSLDVVVIHNALHDLPRSERSSVVRTLVSLLKPGGRLHFREPTKSPHGFPAATYRALMEEAGLEEAAGREYRRFPIGTVFHATFRKPPV